MDKQEAKLVLQAARPNDLDGTQPIFAEALALVQSDPELQTWWEAQQAFDQKVAAKLSDVPVPDDLRERILAGRKIVPFAPQLHHVFGLSAAAAVAILCAVGTSYHYAWEDARHVATDTYDETTLKLLGDNNPSLAMTTSDHDKIMAWLKDQQAPVGELPAKMTAIPSLGCQKYVVDGHTVSLICFSMANGKEAHLFIVEQDALKNPPALLAPEYRQMYGWFTASWSDGHMSYLLATQDSTDALKQLL